MSQLAVEDELMEEGYFWDPRFI